MKLSPIHTDILKTNKILHTCLKRENKKLKSLQLSLICKFNAMIIFHVVLGSLELLLKLELMRRTYLLRSTRWKNETSHENIFRAKVK